MTIGHCSVILKILALIAFEYLCVFFLRTSHKPQRINSAAVLKQLGVIGTELSRIGNNINQVARQANRMNKIT